MKKNNKSSKRKSELDNIIPPEIKNDEFYYEIVKLAKSKDVRTVLEIGSSAGGGSTEAFVKGLRQNPNKPLMFCMEVSKTRFAELKKRYKNDKFVKCYNVSSVAIDEFPSKEQVQEFYNSTKTNLNQYPSEQVLSWLDQDIEYVKNSGVNDDGIQIIREDNNIRNFDLVLIDGSEFTGDAELNKIYGAKYILLDDINAYKNYESYQRLKKDKNYILVRENWNVRNGYAIFRFNEKELPIHFFTIVLNGKPFIDYHINVFKNLPFKWHWHIIEGVADLKNDTAWSVSLGGKISDEFHKNGLSIDGTTNYLNELGKKFPNNITVYRKPNGKFWNGKLEMVNAPIKNITEECLLWQIDVDEFWAKEQIAETKKLFQNNPSKTSAFFYCHYFVGPGLVITSYNTYGNHKDYEWQRVWHYKPGDKWSSHEPPTLITQFAEDIWIDLGKADSFSQEETNSKDLVFQHFAYFTKEQLLFKEKYYGYKEALQQWEMLLQQTNFPLLLKDYFQWVEDNSIVETIESESLTPILFKDNEGNWKYNYNVKSQSKKYLSFNSELSKIEDFIANNDFQNAISGLSRILKENPTNINALINLSVVQILTKNWEEASQTLSHILKIDPENEVAMENIKYLEKQLIFHKAIIESEILINRNDLDNAEKILNEIIKSDANHLDALNNLAVVNIYKNEFDKADYNLNKVLKIDSINEIAIENLNQLEIIRGKEVG